jgi:hypothetical protein
MTEVDVSLTDYAIAAECALFTYLLAALRGPNSSLAFPFTAFFVSIALAAIAGGTVHGFFLDERSLGHKVLWPFTLLSLGATALAGVLVGTALLFPPATGRLIDVAGLLAYVAYVIVVLFIRRDFVVAIVGYLPSLIFLAMAFLVVYARVGKAALLIGFLGICTMLIAAGLQQAKWGIHPRRFNHNAVYHVLQGLALWMIFVAARESIRLGEHTR